MVSGTAMFKVPGLTIVALFLATALTAAQPACLPKSVFAKNSNEEFPVIDLGYIDNALTLCGYERALDPNVDKLLGCWTVNPTTAALGAFTARAIPGRGRHTDLDAQNCINGYCVAPIPQDEIGPFFATSTDGAHAAILTQSLLYIFATGTKAKVAEIKLTRPNAPDETNVSNMPWGLLYSGDTLFVFGQDAGPFTGAWVFKGERESRGDRWHRSGHLQYLQRRVWPTRPRQSRSRGCRPAKYDNRHRRQRFKKATRRAVSYAPCTKSQFEVWTEGDDTQTGSCRRVLDAKYQALRRYVAGSATVRRYHDHVKRTRTGLHSGVKSSRTNRKTSAKTRSVPIAARVRDR